MNNKLQVTTPEQLNLELDVVVDREINGIGMGVFSNGTAFLTLRGLARMCGVDSANMMRMTAAWQEEPLKPREARIRELVREQGVDDRIAFYAVQKDGVIHHLVPSAVCMAVLEYYAFEAKGDYAHAAHSYRLLARKGFDEFIYSQVGYNPSGSANIAWQQFHDRVSLSYHTVPDGYFSIFKEIADILVTMIRQGANLGSAFIPDISVGQHWAKYWKDENLEVIYGERIKYEHNYPLYFPQSESNPQTPYCYPDDALGEFRKWVREVYIPRKMPEYLNKKVRKGQIQAPQAAKALAAFQRPRLGQ